MKLRNLFSQKEEKKEEIYNTDIIPKEGIFYTENKEIGLGNIEIKLERLNRGEVFEWENMIVLNRAIGRHFITDEIKSVVNIGCGVATFEYNNASNHPEIQFIASEMDEKSTEWNKDNRPLDNVSYCTSSMDELLSGGKKYDMAVTIDVLEHVKEYKPFLEEFSKLSDYAVISTPNRERSITELSKPTYDHHVQEFNAGELYFILKMFYSDVKLYSLPNIYDEKIIKEVGIYSTYHNLIAVCRK
ncbi:hypothetical protein [Butyrivibrio fibrisolvens]|uniref:hypothetical protein n=1 Tax=Butyrivibrio fibrisolvens TaxID=831 RepID=UPI0003B40C5C|nr:hypothetical protein [Butyrivibrio fibrisolvens]